MKILISFLIILFSALKAFSTAQVGDIVIWKGDTLSLFANPLELHPEVEILRPKLFGGNDSGTNTSCWRSYVAEWSIINDEVYLTNIYSCNYEENRIKADLDKLFPLEYRKGGKIKATWITGNLLIPIGNCLVYIHSEYESIYEKEVLLTFERGELVTSQELDNTKTHKSVFTTNPDSLNSFIYSNINWKQLPDLGDKTVRIFLTIKSGDSPKPESVTIVRGADKAIFNEEALRVLKLLPDWDVYYKYGKVQKREWNKLVVINEEIRKEYAR